MKTVLVLAASLLATGGASAQKADTWSGSIGFTHLAPSVSSGDLSPPAFAHTQADVSADTQLTGALNYSLSDNMVLSVPLGYGFKHKITGAGAIAGVGTLATTRALPITAVLQYRLMSAQDKFRPYAGLGLTYAKFFKTEGAAALTALTNPGGPATTMSISSELVPTVQLGAVFNLDAKWYIEASYTKTFLTTRATLSTGQTLETKLDPNGYTLQLGYKF